MIELLLPMPPSVNELFFNRKNTLTKSGKRLPGRGKTGKYRAWLDEAGWELKRQKQQPITGKVSVMITVEDVPGADIDNTPKAVIDLISKHHHLIDGDSRKTVRTLSLAFCDRTRGVRVKVFRFE